MGKWPDKWKFCAILLLFLLILPTPAQAAFGNNAVDGHQVSLIAETEGAPVQLRFPMTVALDAEAGNYPLYFQLEGLPVARTYWLEAQLGSAVAAGPLTAEGAYAGLWLQFEGTAEAAADLTVSVYSDETKQELCYQTITRRVWLTAQLQYDTSDAVVTAQPVDINRAAQQTEITVLLPSGTITGEADLQAQLLDETGEPCAFAQATVTAFREAQVVDSRYQIVFPKENPYRITAQQIEVELTFHSVPDAGIYDLRLSDVHQSKSWNYADVLNCSDLPVAEILSWAQSITENRPDGEVAAVQMQLLGGAPDDFAIELWQANTLLGTSDSWRVESVSGWGRSATVTYRIPLCQTLEEQQTYRAKIISAEDFHGDTEASLPRFSPEEWVIHTQNTRLDSRNFACFTVPAAGFVENRLYRVELLENNQPLAVQLASVGENGWFDLAFTAENGAPLAADPTKEYRLIFSQWAEGGWQPCAATEVLAAEAEIPEGADLRPMALQAGETALYYGVENCGAELLPVALQLYGTSGGFAADVSAAWSAEQTAVLEDDCLTEALSRKPARAVLFADGIPKAVTAPAF